MTIEPAAIRRKNGAWAADARALFQGGDEPPRPAGPGTLVVGIDEAGLGPNLGPMAIAASAFVVSDDFAHADWWERLEPRVGRTADLAVDDSKRLISSKNGRALLERTVGALCFSSGLRSSRLLDLIELLGKSSVRELLAEHWYDSTDDRPTFDPDDEAMATWRAALNSAGIQPVGQAATLLFPAEINAQFEAGFNKSEVESAAVTGLFREVFRTARTACRASDQTGDDVNSAGHREVRRTVVYVDRLGGRKNYRSVVESMAPGEFIWTTAESPRCSSYRCVVDGIECEVSFLVAADQSRFPVALASMIAKYLRERCIHMFNAYWQARVEGLLPTAGYPVDARRFYAAIEPQLARLKIRKEQVWRMR